MTMPVRHLVPGSFRPRTKTQSFHQAAQIRFAKPLMQEKERLDAEAEQ